jgi:hypothetical protein
MDEIDTTYRLIDLANPNNVGQMAASPKLAKLVPGLLDRSNKRLGIERTEWISKFGKLEPQRSTVVAVEDAPDEWVIGA